MKIAVVGATGLVGSKMLQVLDEQKIKIDELIVAASERSVGKEIVFQGKTHRVISVEDAIEARPDIAIIPNIGYSHIEIQGYPYHRQSELLHH